MRPLLILACLFSMSLPAAAQAVSITHGPMLGRPTPTSMCVWGRTSAPGSFRVRFGTDPTTLDQTSAPVMTRLADDCTGFVQLNGLRPGTKYFYQVVLGNQIHEKMGSFRTLKSAESYQNDQWNPRGLFNFKFEFACGNNQNPEHGNGPSLPSYTTMLRQVKDDIDFAILNGDWLYEEKRDYAASQWQQQLQLTAEQIPQLVTVAPTTVGVWENYKLYLSRAPNLAEWHRYVPSFYTFDDHELVNDVYGSGEVGRRDRRAVFRDIGINAWYDYLGWSNPTETEQPIHFGKAELREGSDILIDRAADFSRINLSQSANLHVHWNDPQAGKQERFYSGGPGDPNAGVYEVVEVVDANHIRVRPPARATTTSSYSIGRQSYGKFRVSNCEFLLLDTRTNRQMHDVRNPTKPGLTMLGMPQRKWLMESMKNSDADFFFVVSSVNFMIPHVGGGGVAFDTANKDDAWTVFLEEREMLIDFWDSLGKPVFVLTGDLHNSFAIKITDRVWEFASGPHNSVNHRPTDEGDRPATGRYQYGPRPCEIRWSSYVLPDIPRPARMYPMYCVVQVNNVFNNPTELGGQRWVAYPQPQVIFQYHDGREGNLLYAEAVSLTGESDLTVRSWAKRPPEKVEGETAK